MSKTIENKIVINQAGEDRIVLEQLSSGVFKIKELNHTCKTIEQGIEYIKHLEPKVKELLNVYNQNGKEKKKE